MSCNFAIFNRQLSGNISLFLDVNLKPKAYFLRHYPKMIGHFGPLMKALRFEAKHGFFKPLFNINKNRKNVFQSMAKRHQFMTFLHYTQDNLLDQRKRHCYGSQAVPVEFFRVLFKQFLEKVFAFTMQS